MSGTNVQLTPGAAGGISKAKYRETFFNGVYNANPVTVHNT